MGDTSEPQSLRQIKEQILESERVTGQREIEARRRYNAILQAGGKDRAKAKKKTKKLSYAQRLRKAQKSMKERDSRIKVKEDRHSIRHKVVVKAPVGDPKQDLEIYGNLDDIEDTNDGDLKDVFGAEAAEDMLLRIELPEVAAGRSFRLDPKRARVDHTLSYLDPEEEEVRKAAREWLEWVPFKNRTYFLLKEPLGSKVATITMIGNSSFQNGGDTSIEKGEYWLGTDSWSDFSFAWDAAINAKEYMNVSEEERKVNERRQVLWAEAQAVDRKRKQEESLREGKVQQARKQIEEEREKQRVEAQNAAREKELEMTRLLEEMERNRSEARRQAYSIGRESDDEEEDEIYSREEERTETKDADEIYSREDKEAEGLVSDKIDSREDKEAEDSVSDQIDSREEERTEIQDAESDEIDSREEERTESQDAKTEDMDRSQREIQREAYHSIGGESDEEAVSEDRDEEQPAAQAREKEMTETPQTDLEKAWKMIEKLEEMEVAQSQSEMQGYGEGPYSDEDSS